MGGGMQEQERVRREGQKGGGSAPSPKRLEINWKGVGGVQQGRAVDFSRVGFSLVIKFVPPLRVIFFKFYS